MRKPEKTKTFETVLKYPDCNNADKIISSILGLISKCSTEFGATVKRDDVSVYFEWDEDDSYNSKIVFVIRCVQNKKYKKQLEKYEKYLNDKKLSDALKIVEKSGKFDIKDKQ